MLTPSQFLQAIEAYLKPLMTMKFLLDFTFCFGPAIGVGLLIMFISCCIIKPKHFYRKASILLISSLLLIYIGVCAGVAGGTLK